LFGNGSYSISEAIGTGLFNTKTISESQGATATKYAEEFARSYPQFTRS
jgi:hypothetical protein